MNEDFLEKLAELEHEQWCEWSASLSQDLSSLLLIFDKFDGELDDDEKHLISLFKNKLKRWDEIQIPYSDLSEDEKEKDRVYAFKILEVVNDFSQK